VEKLPLIVQPNPMNLHYLETKQQKLGHLLELEETWSLKREP